MMSCWSFFVAILLGYSNQWFLRWYFEELFIANIYRENHYIKLQKFVQELKDDLEN